MSDASVHPLLVVAVKAEYIRALEATDLFESQESATWVDPVLQAKVDLLKANPWGTSYEAHPEFLSGSLPVKELLLQMFDSDAIVNEALELIWADERCFEPGSNGDAPTFKGLGCTNSAGTPDEKPLNIAVIGCGQMGWTQACNAAIDPCYKVTWAVDVYQASAEKLAAMPALADAPPRVSTDFHEALADKTLDAVLVLTPPSTHKAISIAALQAGKHVCCEKPLCLSMEEADEMVKVSEASISNYAAEAGEPARPVFFLAYPRRFGIDDHKVRRFV
jgi:hypothetical protein